MCVWYSDGIFGFFFEEDVLRLNCGYALKSARILEQNSSYNELRNVWHMHSAHNLVVCLCGFSGLVGRHIDGVHGGYDIILRNLEGRMFLEFCLKELRRVN